ncbi:MAG: glycosyltransferase [Ignavibacteriaceae bacterium]
MDLSIIIVNYNVKVFLQNLLDSIQKASSGIQSEIIIVDNASDDGSVEFLRDKYPQINLIVNETNLGFGKANNLGLEKARGKFILLLNPDAIVAEDTFSRMIDFFNQTPEAGLAGCKILNPDGTFQLPCRRSFPGPWTSFTKVTGLSTLFPKSKIFARYNLTYLDENQTYEVDAISGSFMMMRKEVYEKVGGFDEQFFMYGEDLDLCYRIQKSGYKVYYVHSAQIIHYKGESTKRSTIDETKVFYNAMHLFVKKHLSTSLLVELILQTAIIVRKLFAYFGKIKLIVASMLIDSLIFVFALLIGESFVKKYSDWIGFPDFAVPIVYILPVVLHLFISSLTGTYSRKTLSVMKNLVATLISLMALTSLTFFFKQYAFSRALVLIAYIILFISLPMWRVIAKLFFGIGSGRSEHRQKRSLVVGTDNTAVNIATKLQKKRTDIYSFIGLVGFSNKDVGQNINGFEVVGTDINLSKVIKEHKINEVIFSSEQITYNKMIEIVSGNQDKNVEFKIIGSNLDIIVGKTAVTLLDDLPLFELNYGITSPLNKFIKRSSDVIASGLVLFLIYPFIFFKSKLTGKKTDFSEFILKMPSVFIGKFSLVGVKELNPEISTYLGKRGLTGLWYIQTADESEIERQNIFYAKNQNIWFDLDILGKSLIKMWSK